MIDPVNSNSYGLPAMVDVSAEVIAVVSAEAAAAAAAAVVMPMLFLFPLLSIATTVEGEVTPTPLNNACVVSDVLCAGAESGGGDTRGARCIMRFVADLAFVPAVARGGADVACRATCICVSGAS